MGFHELTYVKYTKVGHILNNISNEPIFYINMGQNKIIKGILDNRPTLKYNMGQLTYMNV